MTVYHEVLGVDLTATKAEIKSAYREQLQRYHPDKSAHPDAEELFKDINRAKEGLIEGETLRPERLNYRWDNGEPVEPLSDESETSEQGSLTLREFKKQVRALDPIEFEHFVGEIWEAQGWDVQVTQASADRGIDIEATRNETIFEKQLIQAKRYSENNSVGSPEIQQYASLKNQERSVDAVVVVTSSYFTKQAKETAQSLNVKTVDADDLYSLYQKYSDGISGYISEPEQSSKTSENNTADANGSAGVNQTQSSAGRKSTDRQQSESASSQTSRTRRAVIYGGAAIGGSWLLSNLPDVAGALPLIGGVDSDAEQLDYGGTIKTPDGLEISVQDITQSTRIYKYDSEYGNWRIPFEDYVGYETASLEGVRHLIRIEVRNTTDEGRTVDNNLLSISSGSLIPQTEYVATEAISEENTPYQNLTINPGDTERALLIADIPVERPETVQLAASFEDANSPDVRLPVDIPAGEAAFEVESVDFPSKDNLSTAEWLEKEAQIHVSNTGAAPGTFKPDIEWAEGVTINGAAWPTKEAVTIQPEEAATIPISLGIDPIVSRDDPEPEYHIEGNEYDFFE